MHMTPENIIESLIDKFDGTYEIISTFICHGSLSYDDCVVLASCDIVYDQQREIEKAIRTLLCDSEQLPLLRSFSMEVERLRSKISPNLEKLKETQLPMMYDVTMMSETIDILQRAMNIKDTETHKYLTDLVGESVRLMTEYEAGKDMTERKISLDADYDKFFDRLETDVKRLEYILNFRNMRKCAYHMNFTLFLDSLNGLSRFMEKVGIQPFDWSEDDFQVAESLASSNPKDYFYFGDNVSSDEEAVKKAEETDHEYFSLGHAHYVHQHFVTEQFHSIAPDDLYAILNLKDCSKRLVMREGEKARVYYWINELSLLIRCDLQLNWKKMMCEHLGIPYSTFNSKYTEAKDSKTKRTVEMRDKIKEFSKKFKELATA